MRSMMAGFAIVIFATSGFAQPAQRKPGAEEARIGYFAGQWKFEGEVKPSPMGPGGKMSGTETCTWFDGGFHLVCRSQGTGPMGAATGQSIMGYDPSEKTYTYYAINSLGIGFFVRGTVADKVWTWNSESKMEGKVMKARVTVTEQSPTAYTFKMEGSVDGGPWSVIEEAKITKVK